MPGADQYRCKSCNEEFFVVPKVFFLNPFPEKWLKGPGLCTPEEREQRRHDIPEWERSHQQVFVCDRCKVILFLPRAIEAAAWHKWKRENSVGYTPYTDYPFLVKLADKV